MADNEMMTGYLAGKSDAGGGMGMGCGMWPWMMGMGAGMGFGVDRMEFWAEMAKAFMHDKDAQPGKVKLYYECIAKKGEE